MMATHGYNSQPIKIRSRPVQQRHRRPLWLTI